MAESHDDGTGNVVGDFSDIICQILLEGFGMSEVKDEGGAYVHLDLDLDQEPATVNEKTRRVNPEENESYQVTPCPRCRGGWLKRPCKICNGTGKVAEVVCTMCRGTGEYVLRPTKHFEGKSCYSCKGSGMLTKKIY